MSLAEVPVTVGEAMEKLEAAETGYNIVSCKSNPLPENPKTLFPSSFRLYDIHCKSSLIFRSINQAKKTASDLTRACLVVQHAHHYFTRALKISDDIRGTAIGRASIGALGGGGGIGDMTKKIQYGGMGLLLSPSH